MSAGSPVAAGTPGRELRREVGRRAAVAQCGDVGPACGQPFDVGCNSAIELVEQLLCGRRVVHYRWQGGQLDAERGYSRDAQESDQVADAVAPVATGRARRLLQLPISTERRAWARNFAGDEPATRRNAVLNALSDW